MLLYGKLKHIRFKLKLYNCNMELMITNEIQQQQQQRPLLIEFAEKFIHIRNFEIFEAQ